jgi:preprotein translocase subunit YajC
MYQAAAPWLLYAQAATTTAAPGQQPGLGSIVPMLLMFFAIMYFVMIRPQQKRDRERRDLLTSLAKGDAVVTTGGICGTIVHLNDNHVVLRVDDNTKIEFIRSAVAQVIKKASETKSK